MPSTPRKLPPAAALTVLFRVIGRWFTGTSSASQRPPNPYSRSSATSKVRASERRECLSLRNGTALADGYRCDQLPEQSLTGNTWGDYHWCARRAVGSAVRSDRAGNVVRTLRRSEPGVSGVRGRADRARLFRVGRQPHRAVLDRARICGLLRAARHVLSCPAVRQGRRRAVGPGPASSHAG